ncbi:hypothetical protein IJG29_03815 [Candidatus Saccharibacteria bacterium]|nr:hypothetical protein [Candidatus Saccharibacteria bacterium]
MSNNFFQFRYTTSSSPFSSSATYQWSSNKYIPTTDPGNIDYWPANQFLTGVSAVDRFEINWADVTTEAGYATLHFETNLVWWADITLEDDPVWNSPYSLRVLQARFFPSGGSGTVLNIESSSVSYATTSWDFGWRNTLTIYVDLTLSGVPENTTGNFNVDIGIPTSSNIRNPFYLLTDASYPDRADAKLYVEQNPTVILFSSNLDDALLSQQIAQQETMIQQNQTIIDQNNQDRSNMENTSDSASDSADSSAASVTNASSSLLVIIGNFINVVLHPPQSDCNISGDMGHMDLGQINLCQLSLPPAFAVIGSILLIGLLIPFVISLINTFLELMKGATQ